MKGLEVNRTFVMLGTVVGFLLILLLGWLIGIPAESLRLSAIFLVGATGLIGFLIWADKQRERRSHK